MKRIRKGERGASLPETAIVIAVVLALLFAVIDFGRAMYTYSFMAQLARQGARWAIVRGSQCTVLDHCPNVQQSDIQTYVRSLSIGATDPTQINVTASWPAADCPPGLTGEAPGCVVVVTVKYPFSFMLPYMPGGQLATINMSSTSQMVISQ
jgi:Flp pilus assembly protein TadG